MQYLPGDGEILASAYMPRQAETSEYAKKYNNSSVYKFSRGQTKVPEPMLTEISSADFPLADRGKNLYFYGAHPGMSFFKKSLQGDVRQWVTPINFVNVHFTSASPDGAYVAFIYSFYGTPVRDNMCGLAILDTQISQWRTLSIPPLESSIPIVVNQHIEFG